MEIKSKKIEIMFTEVGQVRKIKCLGWILDDYGNFDNKEG